MELFQPAELPERLESGTVNLPGIMGVSAGIDYVKMKGMKRLYEGELELIKKLYDNLKTIPEVILYTPEPQKGHFAPLLSFNLVNNDSTKVANLLSENNVAFRGGLHCSPLAHKQMGTENMGAVRVSVASFNEKEEISKFMAIFRTKILKK